MFHVYSDESGQPGGDYDDVDQPVLCQTAVIVESQNILSIENEAKNLLRQFNLPEETEIHAHPCLLGKEIYKNLEKEQRHFFLREFILICMKHVSLIHYIGILKSFVKQFVRDNAKKAGLDPYMISFMYMILIIDKYFEHILKKKYEYFFDTTFNYRKKIKKSLSFLNKIPQDSLKISCMISDPTEMNSKDSRLIQLADVLGYYLNRHRQIEVGTFKHRESLDKHKEKIVEIHEIIKPKFLKFIGNIIPQKIDWKALQTFDFIRL